MTLLTHWPNSLEKTLSNCNMTGQRRIALLFVFISVLSLYSEAAEEIGSK